MKKIAFYLILLNLFVFSGCQPMQYTDLEEASESLPFDRESYEISASDDGEYVEVRFEVIPKAKSYGYGATSKSITRFSESDLSFSDGYYVARIAKTDEVFSSESTETVASRASAGNLSVIIFASANNSPSDDWVMVKSVDVELTLTTAPDFSASDRKKDSVVLKANSESISGGMEYKVDYGTESVTFSSSNLPYTLEGIGTDALTLTVSHKYAGTSDYGTQTQSITVSAYDERQGAIETEVGSDGSIKASNLTSGYSNIGIFSVSSDGTLSSSPIYSQAYSSNSVTFNKTATFGEGFYAGKIRVVLYNNSINDADAILSAEIDYESPLEKTNENIGRQSYSVTIPVSDRLSVSNVSVSGNSNIVASLDDNGNILIASNYKTINSEAPMVGTLVSNTTYNIELVFDILGYGSFKKNLTFTTDSFSGYYKWSAGSLSFEVTVSDEVPSKSTYTYYIYINENGTTREDLRVSPIIDKSNEESFTSCSYDDAPAAYKWNNEKWNSLADKSTGKVKTVSSIDPIPSESTDILITEVTSIAQMLSAKAVTRTEFEFLETIDGKNYLLFYNKIVGGDSFAMDIGNGALNKNPSAEKSRFEIDPYHYALELQQ